MWPFCHNFVTIYDETTETIQQLQAQSSDQEKYNGTKKVIAVTESMNVCLNSVEASFQMIIDACDFAVPALYQLVKNLVFLLKIAFLHFRFLPIGLKLRFQAQTGWFIMSHKVVIRRRKVDFVVKCSLLKKLSYVNKKI